MPVLELLRVARVMWWGIDVHRPAMPDILELAEAGPPKLLRSSGNSLGSRASCWGSGRISLLYSAVMPFLRQLSARQE